MTPLSAMVFAAGVGSRLKPFTDLHPKALVAVGGAPILQRVLEKLKVLAPAPVVVNVHHFAPQIIHFLQEHSNFGLDIEISDETAQLLDTAGGLLKAQLLFPPSQPLLLHNADILTDAPLREMLQCHISSHADVTLLTSHRASSRQLWFDKQSLQLLGWENLATGQLEPSGFLPNTATMVPLAFGGIHIVNPTAIFPRLKLYSQEIANPKFSLTPFYVANCSSLKILAFTPAAPFLWHDVGSPEKLAQAENALKHPCATAGLPPL